MTTGTLRKSTPAPKHIVTPWDSGPGGFLIQLAPNGQADPLTINAQSMDDAIRIGKWHYREYSSTTAKLRVTRDDGSEIFFGKL